MRWHPMVIKWCLRIYLKSHGLYEDLRNSGGLKLPSGRTLSAYNNFSSPNSGWNTENLRVMKESFDRMKPPKHPKLGGLFYDEVKINEGLVFDHRSWELIGFTDLQDGDVNTPNAKEESSSSSSHNLASHVLQFFFRSTFSSSTFRVPSFSLRT